MNGSKKHSNGSPDSMEAIIRRIKKIIPKSIFRTLQPAYHRTLAFLGALRYGFPSRKLRVIAVTGTKGKSTVVTLVHNILDGAGYMVASASTIEFRIGDKKERNMFKMTMPGRFFLQKFLQSAARAGCQYVVLEMTSEGARQYRHKHIALNALIFTNIEPEHIESHGSFEEYVKAKLLLRDALETSPKEKPYIVANTDDRFGVAFLDVERVEKIPYSIKDAAPHAVNDRGLLMTIDGTSIHSPLLGVFNIYNMLAAIACAKREGVGMNTIKKVLERTDKIAGRVEKVDLGQKFPVIVDYAHTPRSLEALYETFSSYRKICVLGATGGGRDTVKRATLGALADTHCDHIILTDEDPYDEDPEKILADVAKGIHMHTPDIVLNRKKAIARALGMAHEAEQNMENSDKKPEKIAVLITGKGTDPYIMGPDGEKLPWSDTAVAREELTKLLK